MNKRPQFTLEAIKARWDFNDAYRREQGLPYSDSDIRQLYGYLGEAITLLKDVEIFFRLSSENSVESFEHIAERFTQETGLMRPGKDVPSALAGVPSYEREYRQKEWDKWVDERVNSMREFLKDAK